MNQLFYVLLAISFLSILVLIYFWSLKIGFVRAVLASIARGLWIAPVFLCFFPQSENRPLPRTMHQTPVHVLVDDSDSMEISKKKTSEIMSEMKQQCKMLGCQLKIRTLSQEAPSFDSSVSPLSLGLPNWLAKTSDDPWVVITDGGDFQPTSSWPKEMSKKGIRSNGSQMSALTNDSTKQNRGFIAGIASSEEENIWIEKIRFPTFSFEGKPMQSSVELRRNRNGSPEVVQVQVISDGSPLVSVNAYFDADGDQATLDLAIPPMIRGHHLLTIKVLPTEGETVMWDNEHYVNLEVLPNTVGVLHLLGTPSWDGRFLRRYLKSEPKYDIISFFILRDPWDSQRVDERELSLIPFPVQRLFTEELQNFRVIILQDFTLLQFLSPEYQENLVKFVQNGGGLLFLGGERALRTSDLVNTPIKKILPFSFKAPEGNSPLPTSAFAMQFRHLKTDKNGPWYQNDLPFKLELADPTKEQRSLATVFDSWKEHAAVLPEISSFSGLHHIENVKFKDGEYTPLLNAVDDQGLKRPIAVASYPDKGRAIWLFTDQIWKMAMATENHISRNTYQKFMQAAMTWLMRQDLAQPLVASQFRIDVSDPDTTRWSVSIHGPSARYFERSPEWHLMVCGSPVDWSGVVSNQIGEDHWMLSGELAFDLNGGTLCDLHLTGNHQAFGSASVKVSTVIPKIYSDIEVGSSTFKLNQLAQLTSAKLEVRGEKLSESLNKFFIDVQPNEGLVLPTRNKVVENYYWIFEGYLVFFLLVFMPIEVVIRRWDKLFSS